MKIAAITNSRIPSLTANSIQAMKVCDALKQLGDDVLLIAPAEEEPADWPALASRYGLKHEFDVLWRPSLRLFRRLDFVWYAQSAAQKFNADLIYTWLPQSAAFALRRHYPVVLEMHADVAGRFGAWWLRRFWSERGQKRLIVTTGALQRALERSTGTAFPAERVLVAPNGVDLDRYSDLPRPSEARKALGLPDCPTAGFTGHFYKGRGMDLLFALAKALPEVSFLCVGGTAEAVEDWRAKLSAARVSNVTLTGFIENANLPLYQAAADMLLMPYGGSISSSSGQDIAEVINPMKMFEYMAAGRAIISADLPSIREILDESRAVFCPPGDVAAWRAAIQSLIEHSVRRSELARNARRAAEEHTWLARAQRALMGMQ
jgi:glycosyltransferase involved in cell wall biosynthesis